MQFFRRIGTLRHKYKMQLHLTSLKSSKKIPGEIYVVIKRGGHKVKSDPPRKMKDMAVEFKKQVLTLPGVTLFLDQQEGKYQSKTGEVRVVTILKGEKKQLGNFQFDIAEYVNQHCESFTESRRLENTPNSFQITFEFTVFIKLIGEGSETSNSVSTNQRKEQSSLEKISGFFSGILPKNEEKDTSPKKQKHPIKKTQKPPSRHSSQDEQDVPSIGEDNSRLRTKNGSGSYVCKAIDDQGQSVNRMQNQKKSENKIEPFYFDEPKPQKGNVISQKQETWKMKEAKLEEEVKQLKQQLNAQKHEKNGKNKVQEKELINLRQKYAQQSEKLTELQDEIKALKAAQNKRQTIPVLHEGNEELEKKLRQAEKEKNRYMLEAQKMKEKYNQDIKKYEERLSQKESGKQTESQQIKVELRKIKDSAIQKQLELDELSGKMDSKLKELKVYEKQNERLNKENVELKTRLAQFKNKIASLVNQANMDSNVYTIDLLTQLQCE